MTAEEVRALRDKLGWTRLRTAAELGVDPATIYRWERTGVDGVQAYALRALEKQVAMT